MLKSTGELVKIMAFGKSPNDDACARFSSFLLDKSMLEVLQLMKELTARVITNINPNFPCIMFISVHCLTCSFFRMSNKITC